LDTLKKEGISDAEGCERWQKFIWKHQRAHLLGYNIINFDMPILARWLKNYSVNSFALPPVARITDIMQHYSQHVNTKKWKKLQLAAEDLGIQFDSKDLHNALADVKLTGQVWQKLLSEHPEWV